MPGPILHLLRPPWATEAVNNASWHCIYKLEAFCKA